MVVNKLNIEWWYMDNGHGDTEVTRDRMRVVEAERERESLMSVFTHSQNGQLKQSNELIICAIPALVNPF